MQGQPPPAAEPTEAELRFRALADQAPLMIWRCDTDRQCDFVNRPWLDFTGRPMERERGSGRLELVHPEDAAACLAVFAAAFEKREEFQVEYRLRRHDGAWRWLREHGRPLTEGDAFGGYIGACTDITEMREAQAGRQAAVQAREELLSELHHRVKNNAQATTSFLSLQAARASDKLVAQALRGAAMRVMLATLVQDRMFRVVDDAGLELGEELGTAARAALEVAGRPGLRLEIDLQLRLELPVAQVQPLALIVNELVVNAARHAFPGRSNGTIRLALRRGEPGQVELLVEDDGIGLPEATPRNTPSGSLGLHLVPLLARQARASLRLESGSGTRATLRFPAG
ncbi:PAS domain S-box protein [Siccirubricoccus sp. KC 17139]|uniref:histidine kinase n=1 Tax=Siccirubricoccus soli TaxID=2899147 RepID=A0ABT1D166_9PROT|nr:PAS domain S-box protein [Siccirubricoccus soli]MCP2681783.1 PAS domain S-box protein [Siccirubricoccus soli]